MSLESITIYRSWPIVNKYCQVPYNLPTDKTRVTATQALSYISGSQQVRLTQGMGTHTGSRAGAQNFIWLPGVNPGSGYSTDPVKLVSSIKPFIT